jgi:hypothetical protein
MKTNVVMIRKMSMGLFTISQRTKDSMFNATELLRQWNERNKSNKEVKEFMRLDATKDFIQILETEINANGDNNPYLATRGNKGATWMHPYLFIDFAMWINPRFKLEVIRFVYDQLIQFRHSAGDNYRGLTSAVTRFSNVNYPQLAKGLNYIVFGRHEESLRQSANQDQLQQLTELQKQFAFAVDMGYIKSFDELINEMRRIWNMKHKLCLK